jgi:hypothetical protein
MLASEVVSSAKFGLGPAYQKLGFIAVGRHVRGPGQLYA